MSGNTLDRKGIMRLIPHRPPILLVDRVTDWTVDQEIKAEYTPKKEDAIFAGHFPGQPVLPGVLMVEALAQTAALLVSLSLNRTADNTTFLLASVEAVRFRRPVVPEETLTLTAKLDKKRNDVFRFQGIAQVGGDKAAEATFTAKMIRKEE